METVGEDLINNAALCPVGGSEVSGNTAELPHVAGFHIGVITLLEQAETAKGLGNKEIVEVLKGNKEACIKKRRYSEIVSVRQEVDKPQDAQLEFVPCGQILQDKEKDLIPV